MAVSLFDQHYIRNREGSLVVNISEVDNEATIVLNGNLVQKCVGPKGFLGYEDNFRGRLRSGRPNILVITLANYKTTSQKGGPNPTSMKGKVVIGEDDYNISVVENEKNQGIRAQFVFVIDGVDG